MSDHDHDNQCGDGHGGGHGDGGPNTEFLDFELEKVMFEEAESIVRDAFRMLLRKAAKKRIKELWGDRIKALAHLAVDEALADADASFAVQEIIETRNEAKKSLEERIRGIIHGSGEDEGGDGGEADESDDD